MLSPLRVASDGLFSEGFATTYGLAVIVEALEKDASSAFELEANVPAASQWLLLFGRGIFRDGKKCWQPIWIGEGELWKGAGGFSKERWDFWKTRLEVMHKNQALREETREIARRAGVAMGEVERMKK